MPADLWPEGRTPYECPFCARRDPIVDEGHGLRQVHDPAKFDAVAPDLLELTPDPDRAPPPRRSPFVVRAGDPGFVRHGAELYEGAAPGRPRAPRDPV